MPNIVVRNIPRPDPALLKRLGMFGVATVHEAQGRTGLLAPYLRPIYSGAKACGSALTILAHPGDNTMLHVAAEICKPGDVIVIGLSSENSDGMLGELLATSFRARGALGVIIDAGCRDVAEMAKMGFPVWSKAVSAKGTVKATLGSINVPVVCAGAVVQPGDAILADDDGVVTVSRSDLESVLQAAQQREERETKVRARLAAGELGLDIYDMRRKLEQLGLVYLDHDNEPERARSSANEPNGRSLAPTHTELHYSITPLLHPGSMNFTPSFHDIAHLAHLELLTPRPAESLEFFTNIVGLHESGRDGDSVYLRAWGDYERTTLKLTAAKTSGIGHVAFRARSSAVLAHLAEHLGSNGVKGNWIDADIGHGPAFRVSDPDGHTIEMYYETERYLATGSSVPGFKNLPQKYVPHGIAPRRLDHVNLLAHDVKTNREFFQKLLGLRLTEQIIFDDGTEVGSWLAATFKSYDLAITLDRSGAKGRLHHFTYFTDSREEVLRAADILVENGIFIETGPHKHSIGQTFFLYCYEPGGNRSEIGSGGYLILDPDWQTVVWSQAERAKGQAWGLQTVHTFHTYGTPPVE